MKYLILISLLLFLPCASAFDYHGITIKVYYTKYNETELINLMDSIPLEYYIGVKYIKFFDKQTKNCGMYWWDYNGIDILGGCWQEETIVHELAHHCQKIAGDSLYQGYRHIGQFDNCYDNIAKNTGGKK